MERINVTSEWRMHKADSEFKMEFSEKIDMQIAFDAMKNAIQKIKDEEGYYELWLQDLSDCCTGECFDIFSTLYSGEFMTYIPAMIKAVAEAIPTVSFKGYARKDDLKCYWIDNFDFVYDCGRLHVKETIRDEETGYFCPECGYQIAFPDETFDDEEIECDDCEEVIKVADLKYVPPVVHETEITIR